MAPRAKFQIHTSDAVYKTYCVVYMYTQRQWRVCAYVMQQQQVTRYYKMCVRERRLELLTWFESRQRAKRARKLSPLSSSREAFVCRSCSSSSRCWAQQNAMERRDERQRQRERDEKEEEREEKKSRSACRPVNSQTRRIRSRTRFLHCCLVWIAGVRAPLIITICCCVRVSCYAALTRIHLPPFSFSFSPSSPRHSCHRELQRPFTTVLSFSFLPPTRPLRYNRAPFPSFAILRSGVKRKECVSIWVTHEPTRITLCFGKNIYRRIYIRLHRMANDTSSGVLSRDARSLFLVTAQCSEITYK